MENVRQLLVWVLPLTCGGTEIEISSVYVSIISSQVEHLPRN